MRALSIRQPFAELILRGIKTVEYRSRPTRIIGQRFHIYAGKGKRSEIRSQRSEKAKSTADLWSLTSSAAWSSDLEMPDEELPEWMVELAAQIKLLPQDLELPRGVIVGSAIIERCSPLSVVSCPLQQTTDHGPRTTLYCWHLADVRRAKRLRKPTGHPQPMWFTPFD
jgi:hypothetical protein